MRAPNPTSKRFPGPGGAQPSPDRWSRAVVIWSWVAAYVFGLVAAGLSETIGGRMFFTIVGGAPILLFGALSVLGLLTTKCARVTALLWGLAALGLTARALADILA